MPEPDTAHQTDLALLLAAAERAGEIARQYWRQDPVAWEKDAGAGPVSEADLAVNAFLEDNLRGTRPDYGWLSEESEADPSRLDAEFCFIIDPIDGTRAFIDGQQGFSHSLAIAQGERIVAAVVHLPVMGLTYAAQADGPATLNGAPIGPSDAAIAGASVLTYRAATEPQHWVGGIAPPFRREFRPSLAWRLCLASEGRFDAALSLRAAWEWDIAAGALIAERAGAAVSDIHGAAMRFNSPRALVPGLVVAGPRLHAELLAALATGPVSPHHRTE
ncbi:3'(2'),5'-bisphosphate nucleotidase CysQ (plasmid) [Paracoccus sp. TK19116]|uniref:3'(2'),5'-bisphosphate nucleotidase CysQ n=1 Tax=Paracoccus albicereus TaxID=2922394 RepID=A0ABT1MM59_9RHOB|nr:3'(2'),5'-bisphosphate nucleotidase CysQ [Paracoccus albicereus]MCQ0969350.1 3'(2'),5'-bisphosphate nucleotidase CysQ [Paracoccus albicereus]